MRRRSNVRQSIIDFLVSHGPVSSKEGRATAALRQMVGYQGDDNMFVQIVSAMARTGELERTVRGKRTYEIRAADARAGKIGVGSASDEAPSARIPAARHSASSVKNSQIDYDELAAVLLAKAAQSLAGSEETRESTAWVKRRMDRLETRNVAIERELGETRLQLRALQEERDTLESQLEAAEHNLRLLSRSRNPGTQASESTAASHLGSEHRALLEWLVSQQRQDRDRTDNGSHTAVTEGATG